SDSAFSRLYTRS
nr:Chain B, co-regulator peptide [synthetic construct]4OHA_B Chain B, co-regulator peptide [synthetic construct]4OKT_B Chain B, co-regulator peptide [synthetic construct]